MVGENAAKMKFVPPLSILPVFHVSLSTPAVEKTHYLRGLPVRLDPLSETSSKYRQYVSTVKGETAESSTLIGSPPNVGPFSLSRTRNT